MSSNVMNPAPRDSKTINDSKFTYSSISFPFLKIE